ncbi:ATP-binding protein [Kitasatospora sp. NPDC088391]|uniref:ATP-binding protein n=1 Tax=Kitasatospora sp. NPDC088391 TaxID=3364074 RepID=UPI0037FD7B45
MPVHSSTIVLIRDPASVPKARRWVNAQVTGWRVRLDDATRNAVALVTSELATNAVRHADGALLVVRVYVHPRLRQVRVEVYDGPATVPAPRVVGPDEASGRGMLLVEKLAQSHGAERTKAGKKVWAELELPEQPLTRRQHLAHPRQVARALGRRLRPRPRPQSPRRPGARPIAPAR